MKKANLFEDLQFSAERPVIKVLFETDFTKELRIAMKADVQMKAHKTPFPIVVEVLDGAIAFGVQGEVHLLSKGDLVALDSNIVHDLHARVDSIVRLTLTKSDSIDRVSTVADDQQ